MDHAQPTSDLPGLTRSWAGPLGGARLRVVPWQGDRYTALVGPRRNGRSLRALDIVQCLELLTARGVSRAVTPAMHPGEGQPFLEAGFVLQERLYLLSRRLEDRPPHPTRSLSTGRPWHRSTVLEIDRRAFETFWRFDSTTLREARRATPNSHFRIARDDGRVVGYAVTGRAADRGYLQRLAVEPDAKGQGIGTDLVHDALQWLRRHRATSVLVNTQERNHRALGLYEHLGFLRQPEGLVVLQWTAP